MDSSRKSAGDSAELARQVLRAVDRRVPSQPLAVRIERRALALIRARATGAARLAGRVLRG